MSDSAAYGDGVAFRGRVGIVDDDAVPRALRADPFPGGLRCAGTERRLSGATAPFPLAAVRELS